MAMRFEANQYVPGYQKARDIEHVHGTWVHPIIQHSTHCDYSTDAIIVSIAGVEVFSHSGIVQTAYSLYFGPNNEWNKKLCLTTRPATSPDVLSMPLSSSLAALGVRPPYKSGLPLWSVTQRLRLAAALRNGMNGVPVRRIILKTDSDFLAEVMTVDGLEAIQANNWTTSDGMQAMDKEVLMRVLWFVLRANELGIDVRFWHVPKEDNTEAHAMAEEVRAGLPY